MKTARTYPEIARHFGVSTSMIGHWRSHGAPIKPRAENDLDAIAAWRAEFWDSRVEDKGRDQETNTIRRQILKADAARKAVQAKREQIKLKKEESELVDAEAVNALFSALVIKWRDYLRGPFIEVFLADETDQGKAEKRPILRERVEAFCREMLADVDLEREDQV